MTTVQEHLQKTGILRATSLAAKFSNNDDEQHDHIKVYFSNCYNRVKTSEYSGPRNWFRVSLDDEYDNDCWCILTIESSDGDIWFTPVYNLITGEPNYKFNINPSHFQLKIDGDW